VAVSPPSSPMTPSPTICLVNKAAKLASIALREASDAEIAAIFRLGADHVMATVDGQPVAYARYQTIEGRRWAMLNIIAPIAPGNVSMVFYALKRRLQEECEPVYVAAQSASSTRLLRLLGLEPTGETFAGKEVWAWMPHS
jgi:hypothetical protein